MPLINKSTKDLIIAISKNDSRKHLLEDDKALIAFIWRIDGWDDNKPLEDNIAKVRSAESIRRTRQKLHEQGEISYTEATEERRYEASKEVREEVGTNVVFDEATNTVRFV